MCVYRIHVAFVDTYWDAFRLGILVYYMLWGMHTEGYPYIWQQSHKRSISKEKGVTEHTQQMESQMTMSTGYFGVNNLSNKSSDLTTMWSSNIQFIIA